jgi:hypothetical protein
MVLTKYMHMLRRLICKLYKQIKFDRNCVLTNGIELYNIYQRWIKAFYLTISLGNPLGKEKEKNCREPTTPPNLYIYDISSIYIYLSNLTPFWLSERSNDTRN